MPEADSGAIVAKSVGAGTVSISTIVPGGTDPQRLEPLRRRLADEGYQTVLIGDQEDDALSVAAISDSSYDGVIDTTASRTSRLQQAMAEAGLWIPQRRSRHVEFGAASSRAAALQLLSQPQRASVVFCLNDVLAFGALNAADALGLDVPGDVTVVGFDDIAESSRDRLALTTVHADLDALAAEAVDLLTRTIRGLSVDGSRVVAVEVAARGTHARPGASDPV